MMGYCKVCGQYTDLIGSLQECPDCASRLDRQYACNQVAEWLRRNADIRKCSARMVSGLIDRDEFEPLCREARTILRSVCGLNGQQAESKYPHLFKHDPAVSRMSFARWYKAIFKAVRKEARRANIVEGKKD